jgi:hypothetical protein
MLRAWRNVMTVKRPKALALKLAACALAGAALTIAVVWKLALTSPRPAPIRARVFSCHELPQAAGRVFCTAEMSGEFGRIEIVSHPNTFNPNNSSHGSFTLRASNPSLRECFPAWAVPHVEDHWRIPSRTNLSVAASGWPCIAMRGDVLITPAMPRRARTAPEGPLTPVWPGFALDTVFYGTIAFLLWYTPALILRRIGQSESAAATTPPATTTSAPPPTPPAPSAAPPLALLVLFLHPPAVARLSRATQRKCLRRRVSWQA